ncbi:MAG: HNH endonuclease [Firmicutes bacterium]|nr:HNH endonuclease [Bacillota bacterium]
MAKSIKWLCVWCMYVALVFGTAGAFAFFRYDEVDMMVFLIIHMLISFALTVAIFSYQKLRTLDIGELVGICFVPFLFAYSPIATFIIIGADSNSIWQGITLSTVAVLPVLIMIGHAVSESSAKRHYASVHIDFVKDNSTLCKKLSELNSRQKFHKISWEALITYPLTKHCDTYVQYNRTSTLDLLQEFIELNIAKIGGMVRLMKNNIILNTKYIEEYENLFTYSDVTNKDDKGKITYDEKHQSFSKTMKPKIFLEIENMLYRDKKLQPSVDLDITCKVSYISPAGRNSYKKEYIYKLDDLETWYKIVTRKVRERSERQDRINRERSRVTNSVRYDILKRDGHECKICGSTASDGVKLHVDHIVPVSKGGTSDCDNLQTLCDRCNSGKSNKHDSERVNDLGFELMKNFLENGDLDELV